MKKGDLDIGKQTGPYDTDNVRQRVRAWQADSAGTATTKKHHENLITVEYEDDSEDTRRAKRTSRTSPEKSRMDTDTRARQPSPIKPTKSTRELDPDRQAWVRKKNTPRTDLDSDIKHAGAPMKRVVSDAHWRKDRSPTKTTDVTSKPESKSYTIKRTALPKAEAIPPESKTNDDDGIRVRPMKDADDGIRITPMKEAPAPKEHTPKSVTDRPKSSRESRQRPSQTDPKSSGADSPEKDKIRRSTREVSRDDQDRKRRLRRRYGSPAASEAENDNMSIAQTLDPDDSISARNGQAQRRNKMRATTENLEKPKNPSRAAQAPSNLPKIKTDLTATPVFGTRIEAWLGGTPDPFAGAATPKPPHDNSNSPTTRQPSSRASGEPVKRKDAATVDARQDEAESTVRTASKRAPEKPNSRAKEALRTISESLPSSYHDDEAASYATSSVPSETLPPDIQTSKHMPGANLRRRFPTTGKRLSTIASAETLLESGTPSEISEQDTIVPERRASSNRGSGLKRRLTRHEDLMSVLSLPMSDSKSVVSARSIRTNRTRLEKATLSDIWTEFVADEVKYQRELRTLVDGVIPVLLSCVLSKSDSAIAAGLFGRSSVDDASVTQPIVNMGVALERLKAHHRRVPNNDNNALMTWAQGAVRIYLDYLKAWRMGFQDVVVNLAPADVDSDGRWDDGLLRNELGDLVHSDGERVDVAFLLKRPLVRLKYLAKTFKVSNI
jgi:hypothetical protein